MVSSGWKWTAGWVVTVPVGMTGEGLDFGDSAGAVGSSGQVDYGVEG